MKFLPVYFKNKQIENDSYVDIQEVQYKPQIKFNVPANKFYTVLMVDPDAPSKDNPENKHWLHWMIINNNNTIVDFQPSSPPIGSGEHRYFIYLLEQQKEIKVPTAYPRQKFPIDSFIKKYNLKPIASAMYKTEKK